MKHFVLLLLVHLATCLEPLPAQVAQTDSMTVYLKDDTITYDIVRLQNEAQRKALRLAPESYPLVLLPENVAIQMVDILNTQSRIDWKNEHKMDLLEKQIALDTMEVQMLHKIIGVHKQNVALCDTTNKALNLSIGSLNAELNETRKLAKTTQNGRLLRGAGGIILGGIVGFLLGAALK